MCRTFTAELCKVCWTVCFSFNSLFFSSSDESLFVVTSSTCFHHTPSLSRLTICPLHLNLYQCCISFLPTTRLLSYPPCFWVLTSTLEPFLFLLCKHNAMMCEAVLSARCFWFWPVEVLMSEMYLYTVSTSCIDLLLNVWSICASVKQLLWSGTVEIELCYRNYSSFWVYDDTF